MAGETVSVDEGSKTKSGDEAQRQRSTIGFPYTALDDAISLAAALHGNAGFGEAADDQLAAWTDQSPKSSGFRLQISAARMFGLLQGEGRQLSLTPLGQAIVYGDRAREAKAQAFLNVPLYKAMYDKYRGGVLPSQAAAVEREMVGLGVSEKVKDRARQAFERSAQQAGYFDSGKNRLVAPATGQRLDPPIKEKERETPPANNGGGGGGPTDPDPIIKGLLARLPKSGAVWADAQRKIWLSLLEGSFKLIYLDKPGDEYDELIGK